MSIRIEHDDRIFQCIYGIELVGTGIERNSPWTNTHSTWTGADGIRFRRGALDGASCEPMDGVIDKLILLRVGEDLVTVPHIHVQHFVSHVCPDDGQIAAGQNIFESDWEV